MSRSCHFKSTSTNFIVGEHISLQMLNAMQYTLTLVPLAGKNNLLTCIPLKDAIKKSYGEREKKGCCRMPIAFFKININILHKINIINL